MEVYLRETWHTISESISAFRSSKNMKVYRKIWRKKSDFDSRDIWSKNNELMTSNLFEGKF